MYDSRQVAQAVRDGDNARLEKLLREGANPNERLHTSDPYPMQIATAAGNGVAVKMLFDYGANTCYLWQNQDLMRIALAARNIPMALQIRDETGLPATGLAQCPDAAGNTLLHIAAAENRADMAQFLIDENANVLARNKQGQTALDIAVAAGHADVAHVIEPYAARAATEKAARRKAGTAPRPR